VALERLRRDDRTHEPATLPHPSHLLRMFARDRATAIERYTDFVRESRVRDGRPTWSDQVREAPTLRRVVESPA